MNGDNVVFNNIPPDSFSYSNEFDDVPIIPMIPIVYIPVYVDHVAQERLAVLCGHIDPFTTYTLTNYTKITFSSTTKTSLYTTGFQVFYQLFEIYGKPNIW